MANLSPFGRRLSLAEARQALGISRSALYRLCRERRITYVQERVAAPGRRGSNYFFYERDIQTYLATVRHEAVAPVTTVPAAAVRQAMDVSDLLPQNRKFA